ncbi:MAG: RHS repeat protein [Saprospiraceae bacterium]|nr:RHS repeat protein [Saprospiraceae bacterium]
MNKYLIPGIAMIVLTIGINSLIAQGDSPGDFKFRVTSMLQNRITTPGAPEAASLGKYGDYKVNTFTGLPSISIPLYTLQGAELSMPFGLNYDGGGIKVEQLPTWVGTGWNLSGGGVITRSVKGDPDMKFNYYDKSATLNQSSYSAYTDLFAENDLLLSAATKEIETQPDIYYFNMGSHSGKFYIKADKTIVMAESKDLLITPFFSTSTGNIDSFYVKDAIGTSYIFNTNESTQMYFSTDFGPLSRVNYSFVFNSSWYLSRIVNANATESIELSYFTEGTIFNPALYVNYNNYKSVLYSHGFLSNDCPDALCPYGDSPTSYPGSPGSTEISNRRFLNEVVLKKGTIAVEKIKFSSSANPYLGSGRKLDTLSLFRGAGASIRILNQIFSYDNSTNRLTLTQVQEKSPGGTVKDPYTFSYNGTTLPALTSSAMDHWGYFNNATSNTDLIPAVTCAGVNGNVNAPNCSGMNNPTTGADRAPNETYMKAGVLTRITYPTKGYTDFVWEGNRAITGDLICGDSPAERLVGGLRIKEINAYSYTAALLTSKQYVYKFANGTCSGLLFYAPRYHSSSTFETFAYPGAGLCVPAATSGLRISYTFSASSRVPLGAIQGGLVGYSRVEEIFAGKTVYNYKNYVPTFVTWGVLQDQDIQDLGQLTLVEEYNDAGQKLHSIGYKYSLDISETRRNKLFYGLVVDAQDQQDNKLVLCRVGSSYHWELYGLGSYSCDQTKYYPSKFTRYHYRITQDWVYTKETTDTMYYYSSGSLTGTIPKLVINTFANDSVSLPTSIEMTNSDSKVYKKVIRYTHDISSSTMKTNLINKRMYALPLETENQVDGTLAYRTRTDYNTFLTTGLQGAGPWLLPHKYYERFLSGSDILRETIDQYDISGTQVQEGHKEYDQPNVVLYSQNSMLLAAKIQNATSSECAFTGFETADANQGGWVFNTPSNIQPILDGKTGVGYWGGSGTASKSGVPNGKYILSYWTKNSTALSVSGVSANTSTLSSVDPNGWKYVRHVLTMSSGGVITVTGVSGNYVDELRLHPFDALMTTYSYDASNRLLSGIADENSMPNKFEYDPLLRVTGIRNFNNYYLKTLEYIYKTSGSTYNTIKSRDVLQDAITSSATVSGLTGSNVRRTFNFFDDIGRDMQQNGVGQSPTSLDVIVHHEYDAYGREANKYLPFTYAAGGAYLSTASTAQASFFNTQFGGSEGTYAKVVSSFEASPLNRVLSETPQGSAFNTHPITYSYSSNTTNEVRNFKVASQWYTANTLYKIKRINENGDSTLTYTNKLGQKIMEATSDVKTYYLYDDRQNLMQVIQPKAVAASSSTDINTTTAISNGSFAYTYDALNNLSTKKIPSGGTYTYTYDRLDREVIRQDPNGFRFFTKYDILGRVCLTGKHTVSTAPTGSEPLFEIPNVSTHNYTTQAYPTTSIEVYAANYYDDYDWEKDGTPNESYTTTGVAGYPAANYAFIFGRPTRIKSGVLNQNGTAPSIFISDYLFYDYYGREIQRKSDRTGYFTGNTDLTWRQYDFPGRLLKSRLSHAYNGTTTYINESYTYDHTGRVVGTRHQINDAGAVMKLDSMIYNERDELGQNCFLLMAPLQVRRSTTSIISANGSPRSMIQMPAIQICLACG